MVCTTRRLRFPSASSTPRVAADTRAKAMLIQPLRPLGIPNLALTAMMTREGQLASVQVMHDGVPDAALTQAVSRLASDVRFEPTRARGAPVAATPIPDSPTRSTETDRCPMSPYRHACSLLLEVPIPVMPNAVNTSAVPPTLRLRSALGERPRRSACQAPASLLRAKKSARGQHVPRRLINIRTSRSLRERTVASTRARSRRGRQAARRSQTTP